MTEDSYYYELPDGVETPTTEVRGAVRWRYEGQALFTTSVDECEGDEGVWVVPDQVPAADDTDRYFGVGRAQRVDALGRRWIVESVDPDLVAQEVETYDAEVEEMFGLPESAPEDRAPSATQRREDAGEHVSLVNTSWNRCYCADNEDVGYVIWNHSSDDMNNVAAPLIARNRKIVWLASGSGSGTIVDDDWVLTAAHLVTDSNGDPVSNGSVKWCTMENLAENTTGGFEAECFDTLDIIPAPGWSGGSDPVNDYAVVQLDGFPGDDVGTFPISSASDGTITGPTDHTAGFQRRTSGCGTNTVTSGVVDTDFDGRHMKGATGDVQSTPAGQVKYDTSTALGMSGGIHYYCPTGDCAESHFLTAVQTNVSVNTCGGLVDYDTCWGNSCVGGYSTGPKGSSIRTWVINHTP